ncbi:hypothetical protein BC936DRAFT_136742 [Jimgerdemannia flammicorona]|uniref:Uncharacterized protein n=1 Tax=Jimgerdemannia flammicorona TaxID=994334 RepID=A0A433CYZ3_9FUNG|nr:hypothetical protein BC936DRAFT_136742 [Jimgerdemannia flammicorona]
MLDDKQADRAIKALLKHVEKKKAQSKDKLIDDDQAVFENLQTALPHIIDKIPSKWKNIQSLNLKTSDSVSLPIYNSLPDEQKMIKTKEEAIKYGMEDDEMVEEGE